MVNFILWLLYFSIVVFCRRVVVMLNDEQYRSGIDKLVKSNDKAARSGKLLQFSEADVGSNSFCHF